MTIIIKCPLRMQGVQSAEPFLIPASNEPSGHARMHIKAIFGPLTNPHFYTILNSWIAQKQSRVLISIISKG